MDAVEMRFDLSGRTSLSLIGADERVASYVRSQMDPYSPTHPTDIGGGVVLEERDSQARRPVRELQNPAGDAVVTASDGQQLSVVADGHSCTIPDPNDEPAFFTYDAGFPVWQIFGSAVRPALQIDMLRRSAVAVHSAAAELDDGAVLIGGWSESGKTETALALMERGARFLSDKWTVLGADGQATPFPIRVGIRRWVIRYLPRLRSSLPVAARGQFAAAGLAAFLLRPLLGRPARSRLAGLLRALAERSVALADRAGLTPTDIRRIYGPDGDPTPAVPIRALALLVNVPEDSVRCEPADPGWAATRLARSAAFERRDYFALQERSGFALDGRAPQPEEIIAQERKLLEHLLGATLVLRVDAPFPTDPRRVAEAISRNI